MEHINEVHSEKLFHSVRRAYIFSFEENSNHVSTQKEDLYFKVRLECSRWVSFEKLRL